ncbi:phosphoadenosine phosphosulfate reductase domain-containing protein [Actinomadura violacea]|uniref:Phosphoadenosine phosphosulfate reductase family protein n=1 Tax=Actinomadura violacea TaxID=2819934 RepID=A0ABS3S4W1_9ACTN|nr:phosphoadenosine phosphosulfate reductase family protein [Actinomadura violacea]MBO2464037.1 phosphoadenosine phosphosulfate reductase family protein [Actinomadura violacea]
MPPKTPEYPDLNLASYRKVLVNMSGGKDSAAALIATVRAVREAGLPLDLIETVFADLGEDDEWPGARELVATQAAHYGLRHHVAFRQIDDGEGGKRQQGLLEFIGGRWQQMWPLPQQPYCRSEMKRSPISTVKTRIVRDIREADNTVEPVRILEVMGIRAQESAPRRKQRAFYHRRADSNGRRHVDVWLPVHHLTEEQVWATVDEAGMPWHWVYYYMARLSCRMCIVAPPEQLIMSARLDPDGARARAELSDRMGHSFQLGLNLWDIIAEAEARGPVSTDMLTAAQLAELESMRTVAA